MVLPILEDLFLTFMLMIPSCTFPVFDSRGGDAEALAVSQVEACVREIDNWMCCNKLKLNGDKSERLVISSQYQPRPLLSSLTIGCSVVQT